MFRGGGAKDPADDLRNPYGELFRRVRRFTPEIYAAQRKAERDVVMQYTYTILRMDREFFGWAQDREIEDLSAYFQDPEMVAHGFTMLLGPRGAVEVTIQRNNDKPETKVVDFYHCLVSRYLDPRAYDEKAAKNCAEHGEHCVANMKPVDQFPDFKFPPCFTVAGVGRSSDPEEYQSKEEFRTKFRKASARVEASKREFDHTYPNVRRGTGEGTDEETDEGLDGSEPGISSTQLCAAQMYAAQEKIEWQPSFYTPAEREADARAKQQATAHAPDIEDTEAFPQLGGDYTNHSYAPPAAWGAQAEAEADEALAEAEAVAAKAKQPANTGRRRRKKKGRRVVRRIALPASQAFAGAAASAASATTSGAAGGTKTVAKNSSRAGRKPGRAAQTSPNISNPQDFPSLGGHD